MNNNSMHFLVSDYDAQGSGRTVMILVTSLYKEQKDALQDFSEVFGGWHASGSQFYEKQDFLQKWSRFIPPAIASAINRNESRFYFYSEVSI